MHLFPFLTLSSRIGRGRGRVRGQWILSTVAFKGESIPDGYLNAEATTCEERLDTEFRSLGNPSIDAVLLDPPSMPRPEVRALSILFDDADLEICTVLSRQPICFALSKGTSIQLPSTSLVTRAESLNFFQLVCGLRSSPTLHLSTVLLN